MENDPDRQTACDVGIRKNWNLKKFKPVEFCFLNSMTRNLMWFGRRTAMKK